MFLAPDEFVGPNLARNRYHTDHIYGITDQFSVSYTMPIADDRNGQQHSSGLEDAIFDIDSRWIFAWLVEADGVYMQKKRISGVIDPNSGGNIVFVTPSIYIASKKLIFQFGTGVAVTQHWNGDQNRSAPN